MMIKLYLGTYHISYFYITYGERCFTMLRNHAILHVTQLETKIKIKKEKRFVLPFLSLYIYPFILRLKCVIMPFSI